MAIEVFHIDDKGLAGNGCEQMDTLIKAKMGFRVDGEQEGASADLWRSGGYVLAATVDTDDLDEAWEMTNSINGHWSKNAGVTASGLSMRSSSVGDLFRDGSGDMHLVKSIGFSNMGRERTPRGPK